jgi:hypothetical protein
LPIGYFCGKGDFSVEGTGIPALLKITIRNSIKKQVFSTESKEQH